MRKFGLIFTLLLLYISVSAQESDLNKIENRVSSLGIFKASVIFSTQGDKGGKNEYKGEMVVKGKSYAIKFGQMEIYCDGISLFTYTPSRSEVVIDKAPTSNSLMNSPTSFLSVSEKDFTNIGSGTKVLGNTNYKSITLKPKSAEMSKNIKNVFVVYDTSYMPKEVVATTIEGLKISIFINKVTSTPFISDTELTFDIKRAEEVIDFR